MEKITINTEFIKLNQLLKWAGIADTGAHASQMIKDGLVKVNGQLETRRGKRYTLGIRYCWMIDMNSW